MAEEVELETLARELVNLARSADAEIAVTRITEVLQRSGEMLEMLDLIRATIVHSHGPLWAVRRIERLLMADSATAKLEKVRALVALDSEGDHDPSWAVEQIQRLLGMT